MQENITDNLAAVEQFLHYRVLGIERGIETLEQAFAGYEVRKIAKEMMASEI